MKAFIRAADYLAQDDFECPDPGCGSQDGEIEKGSIVTVLCSECGRVICEMDASEWRGHYEPPL